LAAAPHRVDKGVNKETIRMNAIFGRQALTSTLVAGATLFGMVLGGILNFAPQIMAQGGIGPASGLARAVYVEPQAGGLPSFADLAEQVSPAVVLVQATKIERGGQNPQSLFDLFGPRGRQRQQPLNPNQPLPEQRADSAGSGFLVSADGLIVTNHHVIEGATELTVLVSGRQYKATVKGDDPATDLALLKIDAGSPLPFLALADSDAARVGDWIMVIGSPLRLENSVSVGVISAKGRSINITPDRSLENFIQTDAAINFGNSGGPLVNLRGEVVGIATAINAGASNIGFAVPASTLGTILPQLRDNGSVSRGYLGINIDDLDWEEAQAWGLESTEGALVSSVRRDGPAEKAGLTNGDILLQVDDRKIRDNRDLIDYVSSKMPGTKVTVKLLRKGKQMEKVVELAERPPATGALPARAEPGQDNSVEWLGIQYQEISEQLRQGHGLPNDLEGVLISDVAATSPLYERGVIPGDVIADVNGEKVTSVKEFEAAIEAIPGNGYIRLYVGRMNPQDGSVVYFYAIARKP
jgi:serine protease Do